MPKTMGGLRAAAFGFLLLGGARSLNHGVDAMADTDIAVTPPARATRDVTRKDDDDPDPTDLDRLDASLDDLGLCWGEPDTVDNSRGAPRCEQASGGR
jgi:hypothetical protein